MLGIFFVITYAISLSPSPYRLVESKIDAIYSSHFCFEATDESAAITADERIICQYGAIGSTPTLSAHFDNARHRCCFDRPIGAGVVWAIGESVMTRVVDVAEPESPIAPKHPKLQFETATLQDLLIVDKRTGFPIPDVHITVSDASIHLVAYRKKTDEDGYAVIPMISAQPLSISLRSNGYLAQNAIPLRLRLDNSIQGAGAPEEIVIELDPGVQIAGTVYAPSGAPAPDATIHAIIRQKNSRLWYSDLDNPLPITAFSGNVRSIIVPQRASYSTNTRGKFLVTPLPPGKMTIYATHPNYAPSAPIDIDARDDAQLPAIELSLKPPKSAYIRVEDDAHKAIAATVYVFDTTTGAEIGAHRTKSSGAIRIATLPSRVKFYVFADGYIPVTRELSIADGDEIVVNLHPSAFASYSLRFVDDDRQPIPHVTLLPANDRDRSNYPQCQAKSERDGSAILENCPQKFTLEAFHPDYTPLHIDMATATHRPDIVDEIQLNSGLSFDIACVEAHTDKPIDKIECDISISTSNHHNNKSKNIEFYSPHPTETIKTETATLHFLHRPNTPHRLTCRRPGEKSISFTIDPASPPTKLVFPQRYIAPIVLCDAYGAPVAYGHIETPSKVYETDENGRADIALYEGDDVVFRHYMHGVERASNASLQDRIAAANSRPVEIRLPDAPDAETLACANRRAIATITDGARILVDDPGDYRKKTLLRGDSIESCNDKKIVVIRDDRIIEIASD